MALILIEFEWLLLESRRRQVKLWMRSTLQFCDVLVRKCRRFIDVRAAEMARWRRSTVLAKALDVWMEVAVVARRCAVSVGCLKFQTLQRTHVCRRRFIFLCVSACLLA